jgi:formate dehydrogenase gamma subunit
MICFATALILVVFYNPNPLRPYRDVFSWAHRISGVCLFIIPFVAMFKSRHDIRVYFYNIRQAWVWTIEDIKWLMLMGLAAVNKKIKLPDQGKFNAAEKINFMVLMATFPLYILTGALIWLTDGAFLSWILHFGMALLALPLMGGHIFMATINPDTRKGLPGMISGMVDRDWAKHHYTAWYREQFEGIKVNTNFGISEAQEPDTSTPPYIAGTIQPDPQIQRQCDPNSEEVLAMQRQSESDSEGALAKQKRFEPDAEEVLERQKRFERDRKEAWVR